MQMPKQRLGRERTPLGQSGRAPLLVGLAGHEMSLLIEMVADLGIGVRRGERRRGAPASSPTLFGARPSRRVSWARITLLPAGHHNFLLLRIVSPRAEHKGPAEQLQMRPYPKEKCAQLACLRFGDSKLQIATGLPV
jgi:hypothetical protein